MTSFARPLRARSLRPWRMWSINDQSLAGRCGHSYGGPCASDHRGSMASVPRMGRQPSQSSTSTEMLSRAAVPRLGRRRAVDGQVAVRPRWPVRPHLPRRQTDATRPKRRVKAACDVRPGCQRVVRPTTRFDTAPSRADVMRAQDRRLARSRFALRPWCLASSIGTGTCVPQEGLKPPPFG